MQAGEDPSGSDAVVVDNMVVELKSVQLLRFEFYFQVLQPLQSRLPSPLVVAMEATNINRTKSSIFSFEDSLYVIISHC